MLDIFFRRRRSEYEFPRVLITSAQDVDRAEALIEALNIPDGSDYVTAAGRPSRRRGTVAQLVARRDAQDQQRADNAHPLFRVISSGRP